MARQTVIRHVNWLLDNLFIKVSRKNGMEIYYRVNDIFFDFLLHKEMNADLYKFVLEILKYNNMDVETVIDLLAHPVRRDILKLLSEREYSVTQLSEVLYVTRQSINNHLLLLYDNLFVVLKRKRGPEKYYTLNNPVLEIARMTVNNYLKDLQLTKEHGSLSLLGS